MNENGIGIGIEGAEEETMHYVCCLLGGESRSCQPADPDLAGERRRLEPE